MAMPHFLEDCPEWSFELRGTRARGSRRWTIQGHSVAGERTGFMVKELRLGLDAGMNTNSRLRSILITHGHADHSHNVPTIAMGSGASHPVLLPRSCWSLRCLLPFAAPKRCILIRFFIVTVAREIGERPLLYMPRELVDPLDCMTRAYSRMNGCWSKVPETPHINIHGGCSGGDELEVACGKAGSAVVAVRVVDCVHSVPCVGYILSTVTNRLRPEWQGKPGKEIATARKAGTVVTERHTTVQLAFLGDTTCEVFELHPELLCVPVIMIECTGERYSSCASPCCAHADPASRRPR